MKKLGVGIVGAGWVAGEYVKAFGKNTHTELRAVCSLKRSELQEKLKEWQLSVDAYTDYAKMLARPDIDIVAICTPHHLHTEFAISAAKAGKHIIIEKPVSLKLEDLKALRAEVKKAGVKTITGFVLQWNPLFETIVPMLKDDTIGEIFYGEVDYMHGIGPWYGQYSWQVKKEWGGSSLLTAGIHAMDALLLFVGQDVTEVTSYSTKSKNPVFKEYEYDPSCVTILKFKNGAIGKVLSSVDCKTPYVFHIALLGSKGSIRNNKVFSHKFPGQTGWAEIPTILPDSGDVTHHPFTGEVNHFIDCIEKNKETLTNIDWTYRVHEVVLAADKSAAEGKPVRLPL